MKERSLVSVIIPTYNAEQYLDDCIQSILCQSYSNFEIVMVDDGSTDSTPAICDQWAKKDPRIKVIHKPNGGVSAARNAGIEAATGEYFMMIDPDDYLYDEHSIENLFAKAQKVDADVVRGGMVYDDGQVICSPSVKYGDDEWMDSFAFFSKVMQFSFTTCSILYKRSSVHCRFDESLRFFEDGEFLFHLFVRDLKCSSVSDFVYVYRRHQGSLTTSANPGTINAFKIVTEKVCEYSGICYSKQMAEYYLHCSLVLYYWTINKLCDRKYYRERSRYINEYGLEKFRHSVLRKTFSLGKFNKAMIYVVLPLKIGTLLHPIVD